MSTAVIIAGIGAWFTAGAILSWYARRNLGKGMSEYFLANRKVGGFVSAMTYSATTYSAFMMVGLVGLTYSSGIGALGFEMTYLAATVILMVIFAPRYWAAGRLFDLVTPSELLSKRYESPLAGAVSAILCLVMLIPYASVQLMGIGYLFEILSGGSIPFMTGMLIAAGVSLVFSWWAGLRSVALTDALQAVIMLAASLLLLYFITFGLFPEGFGSALALRPDLLKVTWSFPLFVGLTLPWAFFAVTNPQVVQRLYVPEGVRSLRRMILGFSAFGFIYTLLCVLFGLAAAAHVPGLERADNAMAMLLASVPTPLALLVALSIMGAAVSTMNSVILTLSSMFGRDVVKALAPRISEEKELRLCRALIPLITVVCFFFAKMKLGLIAVLSSMASGGLLMQLPAILGVFFWKRATAAGAVSSMITGGVAVGYMYVRGIKPLGHWPPLWGLLLSGAVFVSVSLLTRRPEGTDSFMKSVNDFVRSHFGT
ncbi:MAG: sodium:solute symporter family protein [Thermovirgaceae bacterium]|nr:sodium:solute symporter family protein [Thermovirgaceae bacterium]